MPQLHTNLVRRDSTPYYPEWHVIVDTYEFFIGQDGTVISPQT